MQQTVRQRGEGEKCSETSFIRAEIQRWGVVYAHFINLPLKIYMRPSFESESV